MHYLFMSMKTLQKKIIVYRTQTCPYCHLVEDFLKEHKLKFISIDVGEDQKAAEEMIKKSKQMSVPVIDVSGTIIIGFDKTALKKSLGLK